MEPTRAIALNVNGRPVSAAVEPRTHLADFLREEMLLTGTHLGCEHGICGACTVMLDGAPVRSCLTFTVACEGREVRTVEDFDDDPLMRELRAAFTAEHALQCGYCTPGMLASAHDIVSRLPDADERRVREELSGNLCRCTGYLGIVLAIRRVLASRADGQGGIPGAASWADSDGPRIAVSGPPPPVAVAVPTLDPAPPEDGATRIRQEFTLPFPRDRVWAFMADVEAVAGCMPGARLEQVSPDGRLQGRIAVHLGPIRAAFSGEGDHRRDDGDYTGSIAGEGGDDRSGSRVRGVVRYALDDIDAGAATRVEVVLGFTLTGIVAQFTRSGLVLDLAGRLTEQFARNLEDRLSGRTETGPVEEIGAGSLLASVLWARIKRLLGLAG